MEDNNNSFIVKVLAATLIAILALNVYRTETTKKQLSVVSQSVTRLSERLDTLEYPNFSGVGDAAAKPSSEIKELTRAVSGLQKRVESLESKYKNAQSNASRPSQTTQPSAGTVQSGGSNASAGPNGRVSVTAKVKVENRYVSGTTYVPKVTTGPTGVVVINVSMDNVGIVGSASIGSETTITNEDILDLCKEAALKTHFSYNPDAPRKSSGTITYTFTAR